MTSTYPLVIKARAAFIRTLTYEVNGVPTQINNLAAVIRSTEDDSGVVVLDLATYITQSTPGVMVLNIPSNITAALDPSVLSWWDMFGTPTGLSPIKLVDTSLVTVVANVSV